MTDFKLIEFTLWDGRPLTLVRGKIVGVYPTREGDGTIIVCEGKQYQVKESREEVSAIMVGLK